MDEEKEEEEEEARSHVAKYAVMSDCLSAEAVGRRDRATIDCHIDG